MSKKLYLILTILFSAMISGCGNSDQTESLVTSVSRVTSPEVSPTPGIVDFAYVVNIDKDANISVSIQNDEGSPFIKTSDNLDNIANLFSSLPKAAKKVKTSANPIVIFKADNSLSIERVFKVITAVRDSSDQKMRVDISDTLSLFVPEKPTEEELRRPKPNPQMLVARLDHNKNVILNMEDQGNLSDTTHLENRLKGVFEERKSSGAFREGSDETEKTVYIQASTKLVLADVIRLSEALQRSGASPIGLEIYDFSWF